MISAALLLGLATPPVAAAEQVTAEFAPAQAGYQALYSSIFPQLRQTYTASVGGVITAIELPLSRPVASHNASARLLFGDDAFSGTAFFQTGITPAFSGNATDVPAYTRFDVLDAGVYVEPGQAGWVTINHRFASMDRLYWAVGSDGYPGGQFETYNNALGDFAPSGSADALFRIYVDPDLAIVRNSKSLAPTATALASDAGGSFGILGDLGVGPVAASSGGPNTRGLFNFDFSTLPSDLIIESARLSLTADTYVEGGNGGFAAYRLDGDGALTGSDATQTFDGLGSVEPNAAGNFVIDLDPVVLQAGLASGSLQELLLVAPTNGDSAQFSVTGPTAPRLEIDYRRVVPVTELVGDFDANGEKNAVDIDLLAAVLGQSVPPADPKYDLDGDGDVDKADMDELVLNILGTFYGDSNLDGIVNGLDATLLIDNFGQPGGFAAGDFTGDGFVNGLDATVLIDNFGRGTGGAGLSARMVPEPGSIVLMSGLGILFVSRRRGSVGR